LFSILVSKLFQINHMRQRWFLISVVFVSTLLLNSECIFAQDSAIVKGKVTNKRDEPVLGATVRILAQDSTGLLLAYAFSNKDGLYEVNFARAKGQQVCIQISSLGYQTINYMASKNQPISSIDFQLLDAANDLPTVLVKSAIPIIRKGDTTNYNVQSFAKGNEQTIANLLQRLPGLQVSDNGRLSFNGKEISRVLIEGDDLFENNYETLINNTGTSGLSKISVIENYKDTTNLSSRFSGSGETVLNLGYTSGKKRTYGDVSAFSGLPLSTYELKSSSVSFSKSIKLVTNLNRNTNGTLSKHISNTSQDLSNIQKFEQSALYSGPPVQFTESSPRNIANNRLFYNNSALYSGNIKMRFSPKFSVKSIVKIIDDAFSQTQRREINYLTNQSVIAFQEKNLLRKKDKSLSIENELDWKPSSKIQSKLSFDISNIRNHGLQMNEINGKSTNQHNSFTNESYFISSHTSFLTGINHSLSLHLQANKKSFDNPFFTNNLLVDDFFTQPIARYKSLQQDFLGKHQTQSADMQFNLKKGAFSHTIAASYILHTLDAQNGLQLFNTDSINPVASHQDFALKNIYRQRNYGIRYALGYQVSRSLQASFTSSLEVLNISASGLQDRKQIFSPGINFQQKINTKSLWIGSLQMNPIYPRLLNLSSNYFLTTANSVSKGTSLLNITNRFIINTSYLFFDPIQSGIIGQLSLNYSNNPLTYLQNVNFSGNLIVNEHVVSNEANRFTTVTARVEKKFYKSNSWIILTSNFTDGKVYGLAKSIINKNDVRFFKQDLQIKYEVSNYLNIRSGLTYQQQVQENKQGGLGKFTNADIIGKLQLEANYCKSIYFDFSLESISNKTERLKPVNILFADIQLRFINKHQLSYFLGCKNIFNQKDLRFSSASAIQTNILAFNLFERYFSAGLAVKF